MVPGAGARALNPFQPSAERQAAATTMRNEGVPVTAGQVTGNPILKAVENPFGTFNENQLKNFTEAAMSRTGQRTLANPEHIDAALNRIGGEFDRVGSTHDVIPDPQLYNDVQSAVAEYHGAVAPNAHVPRVERMANDIVNQAQTMRIIGPQYLNWRSDLGQWARAAKDPELRNAYYGLQGALDSAMERSMVASGAPQDVAAFQTARTQYRNLQPIIQAATSGGENAALGNLTPGKLGQAVTSLEGRAAKARGRGDYTNLTNAANAVMTPLPNSGTPVRVAGGALGTLAGALFGGGVGAGAGAAVGSVAGPFATAALVRNPLSQFYLSGRLAPGLANQTSTVGRDALAQALIRSVLPKQIEQPKRQDSR